MSAGPVPGHRYGDGFFDYVDASAGRSAAAFLARLELGFFPQSVLDVGCGRGVWLAEWKARGVGAVLGLDGAYVDRAALRIPAEDFQAADLSEPFDLGRRFDLVQCLEVAEHLAPSSAAALVEALVRHGDVVLFSAAPPGQGGEHHVNEQPLGYWVARFAEHGYSAFDAVRPAIRGVAEIEPWYRYNALLFANVGGAARLAEGARRRRLAPGEPPPSVAPLSWRLRCAVLGLLPRPAIELLARAAHLLRRG